MEVYGHLWKDILGYYTGIGSRDTPFYIQMKMKKISLILSEANYVLRSGAAAGADIAFEKCAGDKKEIYLPWKSFNDSESSLYHVDENARELASKLHPGWDWLSDNAKELMARNCYQVLGLDLATPSDFVICWTPDGCESEATRTTITGGTGQAIALADRNKIPIYNLKNANALSRFVERFNTIPMIKETLK